MSSPAAPVPASRNWLKAIIWFAVVIALALALLAAAAVLEWSRCVKSPFKTEQTAALSISPEKPSLGDEVKLSARFLCDWPTRPAAASMTCGEGSETISGPALTLKSFSWGRAVYELSASIRPFRSGTVPEGSLHLAFSKGSGLPNEFELKLPAISVDPVKVEPGSKLEIAGKLPARTPLWVWIVIGAVVTVAFAVAAWLLWKRFHKVVPPPPPWTMALDAIAALKRRLASSPASAAACLSELSDILRRYLEARFQLHARTQTSVEFLSGLDKGDSPLSSSQRAFLKEFLVAADMVKFALASADRKLLDDAILRAEKLVSESIPAEPDAKQPQTGSADGQAKTEGGSK